MLSDRQNIYYYDPNHKPGDLGSKFIPTDKILESTNRGSMLSDRQILAHNGFVSPFDPTMVQPSSLDVRLGYNALIPEDSVNIIRVGTSLPTYAKYDESYKAKDYGGIIISPQEFLLCETLETITLPADISGKYEGKSSLGRLGLMTHVTAGFIDPGYHGVLTLELYNVGPWRILLPFECKIGQVVFHQLDQPALHPYGSEGLGSRYQDSDKVRGCENA